MSGLMCGVRFFIVLIFIASTGFGCSKKESGSSTESNSTDGGKASNTPKSMSKSGYATGHLTTEDGKPIAASGAKLSVWIEGISSKSGEKLNYSPKINADGSYEQKLVDGTYHFGGSQIDVPFNGNHFLFKLEAVGDDRSDRESDKPIVQDYLWKLKGLRAGQDADEANFTHWYGCSVTMQFQFYREDIKKSMSAAAKGTKCVFTLTPKGKMVDGSDGKELTFTREYDPLLNGLKNSNLQDIPLGVYNVKGEEVAPDGTKTPLLIKQEFAKFGDSSEITFAPGSSTGAWPTQVGFTRAAN